MFSNDQSQPNLETTIETVKFVIDTSLLITVEKMSSSVPVMLFLVDINSEDIYFVCLNDYIEKVIIPKNSCYDTQDSITIDLPLCNKLDDSGIKNILFYSKRPKFYSFFNKIKYQNDALKYVSDEDLIEQCSYFVKKLLRFDVWSVETPYIKEFHKKLKMFDSEQSLPEIKKMLTKKKYDNVDKEWETSYSAKLFTKEETIVFGFIRSLWESLDSISGIYEECWRECFLPTYYHASICEME
ncbi:MULTISPECIES: DUF4365 domain-containing protein [Psychrilyobacter]|uniref:DUF4365 domain-containing protein n=1 Tax=Psychrilyobacter piezotolerans TaxID=2293438 RepID=A0ABX9KFY8_9FUSO|nr:DUF4365 domain-containing protein [Psychrilyobacter piezotolerans]RDE60143.1 DUF4365 domain-containing protein [Psychrilyobacter sp. S5]REI40325.1 DUF4365 domain-containing protein [Psychrilyobacter piezotolerans]